MDKMSDTRDKFWAGGFLYDPAQSAVFLHKRDGNTKINPNKWAFFGGLNEGKETFKECFARELHEEIGLSVSEHQIIPLCSYMNTELNTFRVVFYVESQVDVSDLKLGEGAGFGWIIVSDLSKYDLTDKTKDDLEVFIARIQNVEQH
jgi:8-oxo-dGTP pyrophosphatase MutT (NUDIX family)